MVDRRGPDDCWPWTGKLTKTPGHAGYGVYKLGGKGRQAHRWSWEEANGPIPGGLPLDHRCHNADPTCPRGDRCQHRRCVNPAHLEPVTARENMQRAFALLAHCKNGHPYDDLNTYIRPSGQRDCRACIRARVAAYKTRCLGRECGAA